MKKRNIISGILLILLIIVFVVPLSIAIIEYPSCDNEIYQKALELSDNNPNETDVVIRIADWVSRNITWSSNYYCKRMFTDCETLFKKCGACGEKADLITSLLNSIGINISSVRTRGEDHTWNHYNVNDTEIFFEATWRRLEHFNMSKDEFEKMYNKNLSTVEVYYPHGMKYDVTRDYTNVTRIKIRVIDMHEKPMDGVTIVVQSHFLMENHPEILLKIPRESTRCITNISGYCEFELGYNRYTFIAMKNFIPLDVISNITILENQQPQKFTLNSPFNPDKMSIFLVIVLVILIILVFWTYGLIKNLRQSKK